MAEHHGNEAAADAVLTASRTVIAVATQPLGTAGGDDGRQQD